MSSSAAKPKPSTRKIAAFVLAALGIGGLSAASAATLDLKSQTLGAGTVDVAACQQVADGAVDVSFSTALAGGEYTATAVNLSNVSAQCAGLKYKVAVDGADEQSGTIPEGAGSFVVALPGGLSAASVENVSVIFYS